MDREVVKRVLALASLVATIAVSRPGLADGGYYSGALGARASGRSGAFAARADDPTAVYYNPAGLADVGGTVLIVGNRVSHNGYAYTRAPTLDWGNAQGGVAPMVSFDEVTNGKPWQPLEPLIAAASNLGLRDWGFALAAFAVPGVSRYQFPPSGGQRYLMVGREAIIVEYTASAAWKLRDVFGVGATLGWIYVPKLDYSLIIDGTPFAGSAYPVSSPLDMLASTSGSDPFTMNAILGAWYRPAPFLQIGVSGQVIPTSIVTQSRLTVTPLDPAVGEVALTREGVPANDVDITLPLPLLARGGIRYRHLAASREVFDLELDVEYETWSRVKEFTVQTNSLFAMIQGANVDLGVIRIPKQWRDTLAVRLGGDVMVVPDRWTLRGGAFYETAVSPNAYANVDFPGGQMLGGSLGSSVHFGRFELAVAYQFRRQLSFSISEENGRVYQQVPASACDPPYTDPTFCNENYLGQPAPTVNGGRYRAASHFLSLALLYRFGS